jgi:hypothetical protein
LRLPRPVNRKSTDAADRQKNGRALPARSGILRTRDDAAGLLTGQPWVDLSRAERPTGRQ